VPAVMLTDTANFRTPFYHTPRDTIDTLDLDRFALVVRGLAGALHEMAQPLGPAGEPLPPPRPAPPPRD